MSYIYLDESGDLGFDWKKQKTSKIFLVTALFVKDNKPLDKIIKKIFRGFSKHELKRHPHILHCYKESPKTRSRVLQLLQKLDIFIVCIWLNKKKVYTNLQNEKHVLYNFVANILLDRIYAKKLIPKIGNIHLVASRRETNKFLNDNFKQYLTSQIQNNHRSQLTVEIMSPHEEKGLQSVDFICWSIFRKYEHSDHTYYDLIKSKIVEENPLFP